VPQKALFLAVDRAMFPQAVFAAHSALETSRANAFDVIIGVPENSIEPAWLEWAQTNVGVIIKETRLREHVGIAKTRYKQFPPSVCYRYLFHLFLSPEKYEKLIYIDADIRITGDVSQLFDLDLGSHPFAACPDGVFTAQDPTDHTSWMARYIAGLGWDRSVPYANSGVLVINPDRWLELEIGEQVVRLGRANLDKFIFVDQDALNTLAHGDFVPISPVWNMMTLLSLSADLSDVIAPAVIHYAGPTKPWQPLKWVADPRECDAYRRFFTRSPWPSIAHSRPKLRQLKARAKSWVKRKLTGSVPLPPGTNIEQYKEHIRTFPFADKVQGLIGCDAQGVLRQVTSLASASLPYSQGTRAGAGWRDVFGSKTHSRIVKARRKHKPHAIQEAAMPSPDELIGAFRDCAASVDRLKPQ
jgi:lipopolysaccharide biosynthesis glycosyltransferase